MNSIPIGLISISDRASSGTYTDAGIPGLKNWLTQALATPWHPEEALIPDQQDMIEATLIAMVDVKRCPLVLTTGGTGPAVRDVTPEATAAVADRVLDGFGEQMRQASLQYTPTAILSRQIAASRGNSLIINLPGKPKAIAENLAAVFAAVPYCLELLGSPRLDTNPQFIRAFRPD